MKKLILISALVLVLVLSLSIFLSSPEEGTTDDAQAESEDLLRVTGRLLKAIQQAFTLIGDFTVQILVKVWEITPSGLKFILGLILLADRILVFLGIAMLRGGMGLWRRHVV